MVSVLVFVEKRDPSTKKEVEIVLDVKFMKPLAFQDKLRALTWAID